LEYSACGVRCKIFMKPKLMVCGGDGTPENPYEITM